MDTKWIPLPGWSAYEVSARGDVRRVGREPMRGHRTADGYILVTLSQDGRQTTQGVHRCIAKAFLGVPVTPMAAHHRNGIRDDNRVENLEWLTHADNARLANPAGNLVYGEAHHSAKLTEVDVRRIRELSEEGRSQMQLSRDYGVRQSTIWKVLRRWNWKNT